MKIFHFLKRAGRVALFALLTATPLMLLGCFGLPVSGTIGGQALETRVDSEVARYYLGNYLADKRTDPQLDARIDRVYEQADGRLPNREDLKKLSDNFSVDFAALYLADQIARVPANAWFDSAFQQFYDYTSEFFSGGQMKVPGAADYDVLFVPTYLYKRSTFTGADMAVPRAALQKVGFACSSVDTIDDGPIETNAEIVMAAISARATSARRLILISASKSGAEVALALTRLGPARTRHVAAWINAVGALQGTPLVDDKLMPDLEFLTGKVNPAGGQSMGTIPSRRRFALFNVPHSVLVVNYFGIPTSGSISLFGRKGYFPLRKYGPNDAALLLGDMILPGGVTLIRLGTDHIHMNDNVEIATVALTMTVLEWLKNHDRTSPAPGIEVTGHPPEATGASDDPSGKRPAASP
ncbi:MAG TPA: hypothetical protein VIB79_04505 [Candidatus Binatia bacterium]|jgi:hypothetical protein